jgi:hypothetical protein
MMMMMMMMSTTTDSDRTVKRSPRARGRKLQREETEHAGEN